MVDYSKLIRLSNPKTLLLLLNATSGQCPRFRTCKSGQEFAEMLKSEKTEKRVYAHYCISTLCKGRFPRCGSYTSISPNLN